MPQVRPVIVAMLTSLACCHTTVQPRTTFAHYPNASLAFDPAESDPKALEIAGRVLAAAGGAERWRTAKQLRWAQTTVPAIFSAEASSIAWDRWNGRIHFRSRGSRGSRGDLVVMKHLYEHDFCRGDRPRCTFHAVTDSGQQRVKLTDSLQEAYALVAAEDRWELETALLFMPYLIGQPGTKLVYTGEILEDERKPKDVLQVILDPNDRTRGNKYTIVVERETQMIVRIEIEKIFNSGGVRARYAIREWVEAAGLKVPRIVEALDVRSSLGTVEQLITFRDLTISDPDETLFVSFNLTTFR